MWFGLMYFVADLVDEDDGAMVMLCAWETGRQRALRIAAPVDAVPQMVRMLREAGRGASIIAPALRFLWDVLRPAARLRKLTDAFRPDESRRRALGGRGGVPPHSGRPEQDGDRGAARRVAALPAGTRAGTERLPPACCPACSDELPAARSTPMWTHGLDTRVLGHSDSPFSASERQPTRVCVHKHTAGPG